MPHRFATILSCIDGRIQSPLQEWAKANLGVDYVDVITEPGADSVLSTADAERLAAFVAKVDISRRAHGSTVLVVTAHADCAGNPVSDEEHRRQLTTAADRLARVLPTTRVIALYAGQCGEECWEPSVVVDIAPAAAAG